MFWAFNNVPFYQAVCQMGVAVRADTIHGVKFALFIPDNGVGLLPVFKSDDFRSSQIGSRTNLQPTFFVRSSFRYIGAFVQPRSRFRQDPLYMVSRIFRLAKERRDDLPVGS